MTIDAFPPGLLLILGALLLPLLRGRMREIVTPLLPLAVLGYVWSLPEGVLLQFEYLGMNVEPVEVDALSRLFATIFTIMASAGALYAIRQSRFVEIVAAFIYGGGAVGVAFAGDLITIFVFWEIMALASTMVLWAAGTGKAWKASFRYLVIHLLGGVVLMAGIVAHVQAGAGTDFTAMKPESVGTWLILIGFLINAAAPPLSAWLADAYPEASPGGMVFLSAFTTKTAVYVLLRGFPGAEILVFVGLFMVFYGIIYALLENDMRRILAYSIVNQVGFMVTGIGIGTQMALNGAAAHAFTHIIYKALLLMSAGSVLHMTGKRKCTDLGGLFQSMPLTAVCGIIGAMAISSFPLTSGFVSKSMIAQAAVDENLAIIWFLLAAASAGVFLHAGIKFPWFVFFQKDSGMRPKDPPANMRWAMILFAFLCIAIGVYPDALYALLPYPVDYVPYTAPHVINMLQLLLFAGAAFFVCLPMMKRTLTISLDLDWFYRKFFGLLGKAFTYRGTSAYGSAWVLLEKRMGRFIARLYKHHGPEGVMARTWPTGSTALWVAILLALYLLLDYV
ncbi:MAG: Na(+)/H(+) antiporter subunit D [Proteobacteria bacterium]|nr:Na(+)/H(+) antiporter subunit D [Pseudomonadota bacterium]